MLEKVLRKNSRVEYFPEFNPVCEHIRFLDY